MTIVIDGRLTCPNVVYFESRGSREFYWELDDAAPNEFIDAYKQLFPGRRPGANGDTFSVPLNRVEITR